MANPNTSALYTRSKGLTEQALAELGYKDTIIFRPGLLTNTRRSESRFGESALQYALLFTLLFVFETRGTPSLTEWFRVVTGIFSLFSNKFQIDVGGICDFLKATFPNSLLFLPPPY